MGKLQVEAQHALLIACCLRAGISLARLRYPWGERNASLLSTLGGNLHVYIAGQKAVDPTDCITCFPYSKVLYFGLLLSSLSFLSYFYKTSLCLYQTRKFGRYTVVC